MSGKAEVDLFWAEEINGQVCTPMRTKRKVRSKKREYIGWGSIQLISFLRSIDKDTSKPISQHDVTSIINEYIVGNNLLNPLRKKRINCDERLHFLFGRKSISRLKIHDLLESHFAENNEESSDESLFNSEDDENIIATIEYQKTTTLERKNQPKKKVTKKPKSCFAAITPDNIKLVYLKRSLVEELLKDPETFESKVVGSFIRIRCDPNDYLQKNSHQLLQVTGNLYFVSYRVLSHCFYICFYLSFSNVQFSCKCFPNILSKWSSLRQLYSVAFGDIYQTIKCDLFFCERETSY